MNVDTFPVTLFPMRPRRPPPDPSEELQANVVSLLRPRLGAERAQGIALAGLRMLRPVQGELAADAPIDLAGLNDNDKLSIKIWLLEFAEQQARSLAAPQRAAYEQAARTTISARLGR